MLNEHEEIIHKNILPRLQMLEENDIKFSEEMANIKEDLEKVQKGQTELQKGQKDLEITVMKDGKETRELLKPFADHYLNQVAAKDQAQKEIKIKKMDVREKVIVSIAGALFGTGGLIGIIAGITALMNGGQ